MNTKIAFAGLAAVVLLAGCAKRPESIAPSYVSHLTYMDLSCSQLLEERARVDAAYTQAAQAQNDAASGDAVGVFFLGMPTSTLSGGNIAPQVANLKGQQEALHQASIRKNCSA
ncbi:hypothetical protein [Pelagibacterium montanilacus]|uniref:hypothetical protein n=1 Tax=Pelagibacterium montanilacus TaxID=2185280 RepID=UPI000F8F01A8|nr:hypothetical protein [Pelagibacterium montanilacus]